MIIQELIEAKVGQMTSNGDTFTFLHSEKDWQNLQSDEFLFPAVFLDMPIRYNKVVLMGGAVETRYTCILTFLYKSQLEDNPDQQYLTAKLCDSAETNFITLIENDRDNFKEFSFGQSYQALNIFDANLDAVILPFNFVPVARPDICIPSFSNPVNECAPATVQSSGMSFSETILSGASLTLDDINFQITNSEGTILASGTAEAQSDVNEELADVTHTDSDGTPTAYPSGKPFICTPVAACADASYLVEYENGTPIQSGTIPSGGSVTVEVPNPTTCSGTAAITSTGQAGDPNGNYYTLPTGKVNKWGHNWRLCGITGGYTDGTSYFDVTNVATTRALAFPEGLMCDLGHVDCDGNFPMVGMDGVGATGYVIYSVADAYNTAYSTASFPTDFRTPTINELDNWIDFSYQYTYAHKPFEQPQRQWWSQTDATAGSKWIVINTPARSAVPAAGASGMSFPVRITNETEF